MGLFERTLTHLSATLQEANQSPQTHFFSKADARVKVVCALLITLAAVSAQQVSVVSSLFCLLILVAFILKVSAKKLAAALASGLFFAALVALPALFLEGPRLPVLLVLRSEISLLIWFLVLFTTGFNEVMHALRCLRIPSVFIAILAMTFRYIFLLVETTEDMLLSRRSRIVGRLSRPDQRMLLAATAGVLLHKSVQMSDDVYHAMVSRGFRGEVYSLHSFRMRSIDWFILGAGAGIAILVFFLGR